MKNSQLLAKFAADSSCHGVKFIFGAERSKATRVFWVIAFVMSLTAFGFYLRRGYARWMINPDISTRISQRFSTDIPFPAITACTPLFAKGTYANHTQLYNDWKESEFQFNISLTGEQQSFMAACSLGCNAVDYILIAPSLKNVTDLNVVSRLNESSLSVDEAMPFCSFKQSFECKSIFNKILTDRGFCYSFNMQGFSEIFKKGVISDDFSSYKRQSIVKSFSKSTTDAIDDDSNEWSRDSGFARSHKAYTVPVVAERDTLLSFIIELKQPDVFNLCKTYHRNFTYYIHLPSEIVTPSHQALSIRFGNRKTLKISAKAIKASSELRTVSAEARNCYFEDERQLKFFRAYSKAHCNYECMANYTLETCGCVKFSMPREANTRVCDTVAEVQCYYGIMQLWPIYDKNDTDIDEPCDCINNCNDINYSIKSEEEAAFSNSSTAFLVFQFDEQVIEVYEYFMTYKFQNFIADTGGLLGLFLGCSVLSIIELFYFLMLFVLKKVIKPPRVDADKHQSDSTVSTQIPQACREKFENVQSQLNRLQKVVLSIQVQLHKVQNSKENKLRKNHLQELSVDAFLQRHSNNINRDLTDILSSIDEDLKKHRKILKMRPL